MSRPVLVFLAAVLLPSLVLGGLALRAVQGQEAILERQRQRLYEAAAGELSRAVAARIDEHQRDFSLGVESLLGKESPQALAQQFDERLRERWPLADVGFAVSLTGRVHSPFILGTPEARQFLVRNQDFLCRDASVEVFAVTPKGRINLAQLDPPIPPLDGPTTPLSAGAPSTGDHIRFVQLIGDAQEGIVSRFIEDQLHVWLWYRTPREPEIVFGAQLNSTLFREDLAAVVHHASRPAPGAALALIDEDGRIVATSPPDADASLNWERPLALLPLGDALPHWMAAATVQDSGLMLAETLRLKTTLGSVVALLLAAIGLGGWLVIRDAARQLAVARQKADFVSNVSHELRTPLTSIRLFAEMLSDGRVTDDTRRRQHLAVIQADVGRLNRLISNVLDFARMDRGEKRFRTEPVDLERLTAEVLESFEPQLAAEGMTARLTTDEQRWTVVGDADALAQVITNLLSNAVKYAASGGVVDLRLTGSDGAARLEVLDRGPGVPRGCEQRIFDQFFRAHDALSSGIQGAGLGLTLARQIARAHGGEVGYSPREGGGSCFTVSLPANPA